MNDKYLNYISLQQITKYCPRTLSVESVRGHFFQKKVSTVRGHFFQKKVSGDTSPESVHGHCVRLLGWCQNVTYTNSYWPVAYLL